MEKIIGRILQKLGLKKIEYNLLRNYLYKRPSITESEVKAASILEMYSHDPKTSCIEKKMLGNDYDLEIIIPAFNVEKYISQCIESVLKQETQFTYHIICIDDGSTDRTGIILDSFQDERLMVIHQENRGFSGARNRGLHEVNGKYIMFLDSDDFIPQGAIQNLLSCAFDNDADIVEGGVVQCRENGKAKHYSAHKEGKIESFIGLTGYPVAKVYRNKLFQNIVFPENYWYEDSLIRQIVYPSAKTIFGIRQSVYFRRDNPNGITNTGTTKKKSIDTLYVTISLYGDRKRLGITSDQAYYEYILRMAKLIYLRTRYQPEEIKKAIFLVFSSFVNQEFHEFCSGGDADLEYAIRNKKYELYVLWCEK